MNKTDTVVAMDELWSVFDFSRRYRLDKTEESRLLGLFGPFASPADLLNNARRYSLTN
jgi:hypothetical protein